MSFRSIPKFFMGAKNGLDGRISDCEFAIHAKSYVEFRKLDDNVRKVRNRRIEIISNGTMMTLLDDQIMC